jgi:hypothetical protein
MNREAIYAALFSRVSGAAGVASSNRRLKHWSDVSPADMPALFMAQRGETAKTATGQPTTWTLNVDLIVYVSDGGDPSTVPSTALNPILDGITNLFTPDPVTGKQTLGGLVHYARISGAIAIDEGVQGDTVIAVIPIEIVSP